MRRVERKWANNVWNWVGRSDGRSDGRSVGRSVSHRNLPRIGGWLTGTEMVTTDILAEIWENIIQFHCFPIISFGRGYGVSHSMPKTKCDLSHSHILIAWPGVTNGNPIEKCEVSRIFISSPPKYPFSRNNKTKIEMDFIFVNIQSTRKFTVSRIHTRVSLRTNKTWTSIQNKKQLSSKRRRRRRRWHHHLSIVLRTRQW